jgi:hypothetical protein
MSVLSDIIRDKNCQECKLKKYEKTCINRYGVRNTSQDPVIFDKIFKNSHLRKQYKFPSGKIINIQGYEGKAIDDLLKELNEDDLYFGKDIPTINYLDKFKKHTYYPDMFIKKLNVIVEVKSDYTYLREIDKNHLKFTQVINKDYRILFFEVKTAYPTPLQWSFLVNEFNENIRVLKQLNCKFAFVLDVKLISLISTEYILEFIKLLTENSILLESKLIATSVIYQGVLINKMFEIIKLFYKTKKPIEFVSNMQKAVDFIDSNNSNNPNN